MELRCPHCAKNGEHDRADFLGRCVICPVCERPFAWREAWQAAADAAHRPDSVTTNTGERR